MPLNMARAVLTLPDDASQMARSMVVMKGETQNAAVQAAPMSTSASAYHGTSAVSRDVLTRQRETKLPGKCN